jgi:hypothetical protein
VVSGSGDSALPTGDVTGSTRTNLKLLAERRVRMRIDRELRARELEVRISQSKVGTVFDFSHRSICRSSTIDANDLTGLARAPCWGR